MKTKRLIEITLQLSCDDSGLDLVKVAKGYVTNINIMHDKEYKGKTSTIERVKMLSASTSIKDLFVF